MKDAELRDLSVRRVGWGAKPLLRFASIWALVERWAASEVSGVVIHANAASLPGDIRRFQDRGRLAKLEEFGSAARRKKVHPARDDARPSCLMACAETGAVVSVEILVEQDEIAPVRVFLEFPRSTVNGSPVSVTAQEDAGERPSAGSEVVLRTARPRARGRGRTSVYSPGDSGPRVETFIREYQLADTSICDAMLELFRKAVDAKLVRDGLAGSVARGGPAGNDAAVDPRVKKSTDFSLDLAGALGGADDFKQAAYRAELFGFLNDYLRDTKILEHGGRFRMRHAPQIQWYKPGEGFYAWHVDSAYSESDRALAFITYLNDVRDGGGTEFFHQGFVAAPRKGNTVIFAAGLTHVHRGVVSATQDKYILTGWLHWDGSQR